MSAREMHSNYLEERARDRQKQLERWDLGLKRREEALQRKERELNEREAMIQMKELELEERENNTRIREAGVESRERWMTEGENHLREELLQKSDWYRTANRDACWGVN